ncbi:MAG: hypothetical protein KatS3mg124_1484 [Porticoccaceae bacterium]|nr:MAG: hypothetical protein KatS3mg124_1484 [Porticoccaceae bacterium]
MARGLGRAAGGARRAGRLGVLLLLAALLAWGTAVALHAHPPGSDAHCELCWLPHGAAAAPANPPAPPPVATPAPRPQEVRERAAPRLAPYHSRAPPSPPQLA